MLGLGLTLAVLWLAGGRVASAAGPWFVDPAGSDSDDCLSSGTACATINAAVGLASSGDTINLAAGTYSENVVISGKALSFVGASYATTIIDGNSSGRVIATDSAIDLTEITLRNGFGGGHGGGLYATAPVTLTNVAVLSSTAINNGGGVYSSQSVAVTNGRFENNSAQQGGGVYAGAALAITGTEFINNTAESWGGGARAEGPAELAGGWFEGNSADSGAGLYAASGVTAVSTTFVSNVAQDFGGGAYVAGTATFAGAAFTNNQGNSGGGLFTDAPATVESVSFRGNTGVGGGGGAYFNAPVTLTNSNFYTNVTGSGTVFGGGAIFAYAATVSGGAFISNTANHAGGGAYFVSPATITGTTFMSNTTVNNRGGGAYFDADITLQNTAFVGNQAPSDRGAGAYFRGTAAITGSVFMNNTSSNRGGGALFFNTASIYQTQFLSNTAGIHGGGAYFSTAFNLDQVTFSDNTAGAGNGGAVFTAGSANSQVVNALFTGNNAGQSGEDLLLGGTGTTTLRHLTLANSSLNSGAAIYVDVGSVQVTNTIFANYAAGLVISTSATASADYNLYFNAPTNAITGSHSLTATDPLFVAPLSFNFHLSKPSPAFRAGLNLGVATDLEGTARADPPTLGAYELFVVADLSLGLSGAPALTAPGVVITYSLVITNTGPDVAAMLRLTDTLAANTAFHALQSPGGWACTTPAFGDSGAIVCTSATLAVNAPASFTIVVQVTGAAMPSEVLTNTGVVTTSATDSGTPNQTQATSQIFAYRQYLPLMPAASAP